MNKKDKNEPSEKGVKDQRLEKVRSLITGQSEDAAKVLKMWLNKSADKKK